jgi:glutaredoxin
MWFLKSECADLGHAGCGSGEVHSIQRIGGSGFEIRYVLISGHGMRLRKRTSRCGAALERALSEILPIQHTDAVLVGIKEYSEWPTIPQLYVDKEFIGGCDILMTMHQDGSLAKMLEEKGVVVPAEGEQKP